MAVRVLSIGIDPILLGTRCAVLRYAGYEALAVMSYQAEELLQTEQFDLIILSVHLTEAEKAHFIHAIGNKTKVLRLENLVPADELLEVVKQQLAAVGASI